MLVRWLREKDLNLRPLGYEPNELPDCSIALFDCNKFRNYSVACEKIKKITKRQELFFVLF